MKTKFLLSISCLFIFMQVKAYDFSFEGIYYNITSSNTVSVTFKNTSYNNYSGYVTIPSVVTNNGKTYNVDSIGKYAFSYCTGLTSLEIPNSIKTIGDYAFFGCSELNTIIIPNSVTSIGNLVFSGSKALVYQIILDNTVKVIQGGNPSGSIVISSKITYCNRDYNVTSIDDDAFSSRTSLTGINIPNTIIYIGNNP